MVDSGSTRLLFSLASPRPADESFAAVERLSRLAPAWEDFLNRAERARLLPLVAWRLQRRPGISPQNQDRLAEIFHQNNLRNLVRVRELIRVCRELEKNEIRALAIKGPVLATLCYHSLGSRSFDDLDLLIHPEDVSRTLSLLLNSGYDHWLPEWDRRHLKQFFSRPDFLRFLWWDQAMLTRDNPRMTVEIHWAALPRYFSFELPFEKLWRDRRAVSISGHKFPTLFAEDLLLLIAAHGAKHLWSSPKWTCDLAWAIHEFSEVEWEQVEGQARQKGGLRMLRVGALLAARLFAASPQPEWLACLQTDSVADRLAREIECSLLQSVEDDSPFPEPLGRKLRLRERRLDQIRYLQRSLLTPSSRDCRWISLPPPLFPLYRLVRPLRLALEALHSRD